MSLKRHQSMLNTWESIYCAVWSQGLRHQTGARAQKAYLEHTDEAFLVVPFLGDCAGPHGVGTQERSVAYQCRSAGNVPDLSPFCDLDFFISPPDLSWTMLHTHEDYALGGPYYIEREWLVAQTRRTDDPRQQRRRRNL